MGKKILSVILTCIIILSTLSYAFAITNGAKFVNIPELTGKAGEDMVNIGLAQTNRTEAQMGYTFAWCAAFVSDVAELAGQSEAIPYDKGVASLMTKVKDAGGKQVSASEIQPGDLAFFNDGSWCHVGIVVDKDYDIDGNMSNKVMYYKRNYYKSSSGAGVGSGVSITYIRPAYKDSASEHVHVYFLKPIDATCNDPGYNLYTCSCGSTYTADFTTALGHDYQITSIESVTCTHDNQVHYTCYRCGASYVTSTEKAKGHNPVEVLTRQATCTQNGEKVTFCKDCGVIISSKTVSATGHNSGTKVVDFEATPEHDGQMTTYCTKCGEKLRTETFKMHTHSLARTEVILPATCTEDGIEGDICSVCGACYAKRSIKATGHVAEDEAVWITSIVPTCTTDGEQTGYCTDCGYTVYHKIINATGHDEGVWATLVSPTCTAEGEQVKFCTDCGQKIERKAIEANGHDDGEWQISIPPTCTSEGEEICVCTCCKNVIGSREIAALGHDDGVWSYTAEPTCEDDGEQVCTCTRCGEVIDSKKVAALGHDEGVWIVDFEATPDHEGQMSLYCSRCDMVLDTKTFNLHEHTLGYKKTVIEPTCTTEGLGGVFCADCGAKYDTYKISTLDHDYSEWYKNNNGTHSKTCSRCHDIETENCDFEVVVTEPTCTEAGYTTHTCKVCGFVYISNFTKPLGHDFGEWTDNDDGCTHSRTCNRCGETETADHVWSCWVYNEDGKFFKQGTKTRVCLDCGRTETETAHHTSFICRVFYPIGIFFHNFFNKILYGVSLNWLFPWINLHPTM